MLLAIETATTVCSVALVDQGSVTGLAETAEPRQHASQLVPLIQQLLAEHHVTVADLSAVAVSAGPGSYTGLRIGASTAKGLAWTHDLDLVAVPSLDALAEAAREHLNRGATLLAAFPSRRGEIYGGLYCNNGKMSVQRSAAALRLVELDGWLPESARPLTVAGPAGAPVAEALAQPCVVLDPAIVRPTAATVGTLGWERWQSGHLEDVAAFEPAYLNAFVAKRGGSIFDRLPR